MKRKFCTIVCAAGLVLYPIAVNADAVCQDNQVTITEQADGSAGQVFTLRVYKSGIQPQPASGIADIQYLGQETADDTGKIEFSFRLDAESGIYMYQVRAESGEPLIENSLNYINAGEYQEAKQALLAALAVADSERPDALQEVFETYGSTLRLTENFEIYNDIQNLDTTEAYRRMAEMITAGSTDEEIRQIFQETMALNAIAKADAAIIQELFDSYRAVLDSTNETVSGYYDEMGSGQKNSVAKRLQGKTFSTASEACEAFYQSVALEEMNSASSWQALGSSLRELSLISDLDTKTFFTLSASMQNRTLQKLVSKLPFDDRDDFADKIAAAIDEADSDNGSNGGSSSGGGSGNRGSSIITASGESLNELYDGRKDNNASESPGVFEDISDVSWAEEAILNLAALGIVNGRADGVFAPNEFASREEFIKILMLALEFDTSHANTSFTDVQSDAWYAPYVAAAENAGITVGQGDDIFGVGEPITREDAVVMVVRAMEAKDKALAPTNEAQAFADDAQIADYAKEAVYLLADHGIINGMGDGNFAPLNAITRAEAAKIIYGIRG